MKTTHCVIPDDFEIAQSFQGTRDGEQRLTTKHHKRLIEVKKIFKS